MFCYGDFLRPVRASSRAYGPLTVWTSNTRYQGSCGYGHLLQQFQDTNHYFAKIPTYVMFV